MLRTLRSLKPLLLSVLLALPAPASLGIIIRHDRADTRYQVLEESYPQLFFLHTNFDNKICIGTLVSPHWAITAAHCTRETPLLAQWRRQQDFHVTIDKQSYQVEDLVLHPLYDTGNPLKNVDLALIRLDRDVPGIRPARLYRKKNEQNQIFTLLGWGFTGIGTRGMQSNDGRFRRAENRVEQAGQWLEFLFDDPRESGNHALMLEGVPGLGDSGGPALLETDEGPVLVGIALGELEEGESPPAQGLYGTIQVYERISSHLDWIENTLSLP